MPDCTFAELTGWLNAALKAKALGLPWMAAAQVPLRTDRGACSLPAGGAFDAGAGQGSSCCTPSSTSDRVASLASVAVALADRLYGSGRKASEIGRAFRSSPCTSFHHTSGFNDCTSVRPFQHRSSFQVAHCLASSCFHTVGACD